jgi:hypothetical protein
VPVTISFGPHPPEFDFEVVYVGLVEHKHGTNIYAGKTEEAVWDQIAAFCREWWEEEGISGSSDGLDDTSLINRYFSEAPNDGLVSPQPIPL